MSLESGGEAVEQREGSLFTGDSFHGSKQAVVFGSLTSLDGLELKTHLGGVKRNGEGFANASSRGRHSDVSEEEGDVTFAGHTGGVHDKERVFVSLEFLRERDLGFRNKVSLLLQLQEDGN